MHKTRKLQLMRWLMAPLALVLIASFAVAAQESANNERERRFFGNMFASGTDVRVTGADVQSLFAAGETVTVDANVRDTAHMAGRRVLVNNAIGETLYAAGYTVDVEAPVGEDLIAAGYRVEIGPNGSVARDVLAAGQTVVVRGPVAGNMSLAARTVEIAAPISGSVEIRAREIRFAEGARIDGTLSYSSRTPVDVPASVIAPDRVRANAQDQLPGRAGIWIAFGILFVAGLLALAAVFAFVFRDRLAGTQAVIAARPWRDLLLGIIATSALFGSILVLAVSLIGIPLIPLVIVLAPFVILAGYLTTAHAIGSLLVRRARLLPGNFWAAFGAMVLGMIALALISAIPFVGWVIAVLAVVVGLGAWFALFLWPATRGERVVAR